MSIIATAPVPAPTPLSRADTLVFKPLQAQPGRCPVPWCERCYPPDGEGIRSDRYAHMHLGTTRKVFVESVSQDPDANSTFSIREELTVELERMDYDFPEGVWRGRTEVR